MDRETVDRMQLGLDSNSPSLVPWQRGSGQGLGLGDEATTCTVSIWHMLARAREKVTRARQNHIVDMLATCS